MSAGDVLMDEVRAALRDDQVRFEIVRTFGMGDALRIEHRAYAGRRWSVVKTLIFPAKGEPLAEAVKMLLDLRAEVSHA